MSFSLGDNNDPVDLIGSGKKYKGFFGEKDLEEKQAIIRYLGHSGWALQTKNHFLIFDYVESEKNSHNKVVNLSELKEKKVSVFISHEHADHYSPAIFNWSQITKNINYILGWKADAEHSCVCIAPREEKRINGLEILTIKSTDAGVGFLVKVDSLVIFHGGDHAYWGGSINSFAQEIDYLADAEDEFDIVFLALATGTGQRSESLTKGIYYAIEKLQPKVMFPMHAGGREYLYKEFVQEAQKKKFRTQVCYSLGREHEFVYRNREINKLN
ncbi:MAG: MBL fold metallo-hydrolase [Patescibacteria group bacterium]|nr:MBL fold metallo-hydrolase [Patescibacteria group bacterium]